MTLLPLPNVIYEVLIKSPLLLLFLLTLHVVFEKVQIIIENLGLDPLDLTRHRRPPPRLSGKAPSYKPETVEEHFRKTYFLLLDIALCQLRERFDPEKSRGLSIAQELENTLLKGTINDSLIKEFPELNKTSFRSKSACSMISFLMLPFSKSERSCEECHRRWMYFLTKSAPFCIYCSFFLSLHVMLNGLLVLFVVWRPGCEVRWSRADTPELCCHLPCS